MRKSSKIRIKAERKKKRPTKQIERQNSERGEDKHFTERGIIMQSFNRVIIGLQAVWFFTE